MIISSNTMLSGLVKYDTTNLKRQILKIPHHPAQVMLESACIIQTKKLLTDFIFKLSVFASTAKLAYVPNKNIILQKIHKFSIEFQEKQ